MQRRNFSKYFLVVSLAATGFLSACSSEGDSSPKGSPVYQVDFYDDAGTQVGYGYAIEGRAVHFRAMDGTAYDYNPHTDMELTTPGARFVFDGWEGTYDTAFNSNVSSELQGEAVNLDQIKGSCRVTAKFKEKSYKIETIFKNNGSPVEGGANVLFGEAITIPTAIPTEAHPEYYNNYNFDGWALSKDDTAAKFTSADTLVYKWKSGANANQNAWGLGAPDAADAIDNKGVIYLDKTLTDHMPTYPSYISDGMKWIGLGNLSKGTLPLEFKSTFETEKKDFTVTMMATDGVSVLSSFDVEYGKTIVFEREVLAGNQTKITIKVDGDTKGIYNNVTSNPGDLCYTLKGEYKNEIDSANLHSDMIEGTEMSFSLTYGEGAEDHTPKGGSAKIQGNVRITPVIVAA